MKKIFAIIASAVVAVGAQTATASALAAFVGPANFSSRGGNHPVDRQPGARIDHDRLTVAPAGQTFERYILRSPGMTSAETADFTIYESAAGDLYSYFWDDSYLSTESSFATAGAQFNTNSWVKLEPHGQTYSGSFYRGDIGEVRITLAIAADSVTLTRSERGQIVVGPIPLPSPFRRSLTEVFAR